MVRLSRTLSPSIAALALAACSAPHDGNDQAGGSPGNAGVSIQPSAGRVSITGPGFSGNFQGPSFGSFAENFSLDGVHLYPGSTIEKLDANGNAGNGGQGHLTLAFRSPAPAATVRDWLKPQLDDAGFRLTADARGLVGTNREGKHFRLSLDDAGTGASTGTITITD